MTTLLIFIATTLGPLTPAVSISQHAEGFGVVSYTDSIGVIAEIVGGSNAGGGSDG